MASGMLMAFTDDRNPIAISAVLIVSQKNQRSTNDLISGPFIAISPVAVPQRSRIIGQKIVGVTAQITKKAATGIQSQIRNLIGVLKPHKSAPRMPMTITADNG